MAIPASMFPSPEDQNVLHITGLSATDVANFFIDTIENKNEIVDNWNKTIFLKENKNLDSRGWLLDIMKCIEKMDKKDFSLSEIYQFENYLGLKHPNNNNIQAKIRQQLQVLRDKEFLKFTTRGKYEVI